MLLSISASMEPLILTTMVSYYSPVAEQRSRRRHSYCSRWLLQRISYAWFHSISLGAVIRSGAVMYTGVISTSPSTIRKVTSRCAEMPAVLDLSLLYQKYTLWWIRALGGKLRSVLKNLICTLCAWHPCVPPRLSCFVTTGALGGGCFVTTGAEVSGM
uniref:AlNc14C148G7454 protein n=1 Tax=Albugo laibachii Nc14 TaxID=890382 RepID=F0WLU1_9STRA|nr:AlNc14C148G7454 [Albugo laibachii Nc14]|eukprot:CCA22267.1 AlNc14C148G7454 [Albugo laibachii Nc14]